MNVSVYAHITNTTEISVRMQESEAGKYAALEADDLAVFIDSREKALEIASLLESAAQKWDDEKMNMGKIRRKINMHRSSLDPRVIQLTTCRAGWGARHISR